MISQLRKTRRTPRGAFVVVGRVTMEALVADLGQVHIFRLGPGDDLLDGLERATSGAGLRQGVILAGIGSLVSYHFHVVDEPQWPPVDTFLRGTGGLDLLSLQGYVIDGRVHAHMVVSDARLGRGGHLERGCEVFTFVAVTVAEVRGVELEGMDELRTPDPQRRQDVAAWT